MGSNVDLTPFYLAVIEHLGQRGGEGHMAELNLNPNVKFIWQEMSLPKTKKVGTILDLRPDLFSRSIGSNGGASVKLLQPALDALTTGQLPPMSAEAQAKNKTVIKSSPGSGREFDIVVSGVQLPPLPANVHSPTEARRYFICSLIRVLAAQPELKASTSDLGRVEELQTAWKAGGLSSTYKMIEIIKERPDLVMVKWDVDKHNAWVHLTNLGLAYAPGFVIPDPDATCPPQTTPKKLLFSTGKGGYGKGKGGYSPY
eukprot:gnl/MRDRNA2_/MRDRNA2_115356_c0_seq1.p1 gnl/MRDRNA2_/MRDRNA2_115356_c0~~gnl/MRDRNA2_/MRDRNA2_115356_c0_seq1.p1  ORF type:complete len:257 (+),score=50.16 gnl/MRDRNA2_/MRDRNA2_115356_c0_seq1:97-867(+)